MLFRSAPAQAVLLFDGRADVAGRHDLFTVQGHRQIALNLETVVENRTSLLRQAADQPPVAVVRNQPPGHGQVETGVPQSRLGRAEWLKPYTDVTLAELPAQGIRKLVVMSPGFSADNLETLEEVAMEGRATFLDAGGTDFAYIPCLNAGAIGNAALTAIVRRELAGWVSAS